MRIEKEMAREARRAAGNAAGRVVGGRICRAHPNLPGVTWWGWETSGTWHASGHADTDIYAGEARRVLEAYAAALGGTPPSEVAGEIPAGELETVATFEGVRVAIWCRIPSS
jgi:hypothetical protein